MRALRADGIAARLDGEIATAGATPAPAVTASLLDGLTRAPDRAPIARDDMTLTVAGDDAQLLPGMLATTLPGAGDDAVVWFRREHARRITWAGDPTEPALPDAQGTGTLHPRASFAEWIQEVRGLSEPWSEDDIESAASIGRSLADAMLTRARERLAYLGQHDALTGLANRHVFDRLLADALNRAEASGTRVAVLFADLDSRPSTTGSVTPPATSCCATALNACAARSAPPTSPRESAETSSWCSAKTSRPRRRARS
jgi:hypothetical protein